MRQLPVGCYLRGINRHRQITMAGGGLFRGVPGHHRRYAHITGLRGVAVAAQALSLNMIVSEDALRRALERIDEASNMAWMRPALIRSVRQALDIPRV